MLYCEDFHIIENSTISPTVHKMHAWSVVYIQPVLYILYVRTYIRTSVCTYVRTYIQYYSTSLCLSVAWDHLILPFCDLF